MPLLSLSVSQLLVAFVSTSILRKLAFNRFFLKWLASHRFVCYLVPTNHELKRISDKSKNNQGTKKSTRLKNRPLIDPKEVFKIPTSNLDLLKLDKIVMSKHDFELINSSLDLEWIMDLAFMSLFSFTITETHFYFFPLSGEFNFSLLWTLFVIIFCINVLWKLTAVYFRNQNSEFISERSICIISWGVFLLIAMLILTVDENQLELGIENAYRSFNCSDTAFIKSHNIDGATSKPMSLILFKFCIAVFCAIIGMLYTFPGLRFGQLHKNLLDRTCDSNLRLIAYNANYLMPLFVVCLWIKPISRAVITNQNLITIDDGNFEILRIYCVLLTNISRFHLLPKYVTIFLESADYRVMRLKRRGPTTTNREIQMTVSSIFNYVNIVIIQYILPILMCLSTVLMYKTLGGHGWLPNFDGITGAFNETIPLANSTGRFLDSSVDSFMPSYKNISGSNLSTSSANSSMNASLAVMINLDDFKKVFTREVFKDILGFATWWFHFSWFCSSTTGLIYHTYFLS